MNKALVYFNELQNAIGFSLLAPHVAATSTLLITTLIPQLVSVSNTSLTAALCQINYCSEVEDM